MVIETKFLRSNPVVGLARSLTRATGGPIKLYLEILVD